MNKLLFIIIIIITKRARLVRASIRNHNRQRIRREPIENMLQ